MRLFVVTSAVLALAVAGCGGASDTKGGDSGAASGSGGGAKLALVAYSTPQVVYDDVIPAFTKTAEGKGVSFTQSYGASGDQSRAVEAGQPADVVAFSLAPDIDRLVKAGIVADDWADTPTKGMVSNSVVALMVRKGNPKNIHTWDDLLKPGVEVLTPNPFTSGGAKWNMMAAYGAQLKQGKTPAQALDLPAQADHQARQGPGQERPRGAAGLPRRQRRRAHLLRERGDHGPAEGLGRRLRDPGPDDADREPDRRDREGQAAGARRSSTTPVAPRRRRSFAQHGYRPVDRGRAPRARASSRRRKQLFTIDDLGGWTKVNDEFFDPDKGSVAKIESDAGVSTDK